MRARAQPWPWPLLLALTWLPAAPVAAQQADGSISGTVTDAETGQALVAAEVHVEDPRRHETSHGDGRYHLLRLPPGRFTVVFERLGYRTATRVVELAEGQHLVLDVAMTPAPVEIEGLIVTGTMGGRAAEDALRPTTVLGGRELQRRMDVTVAETLEGEAGVAVASMGPAPARPVIRGLGGDRVLILEDGERVGDVSASSADHAVAMDPLGAERVEVVRGPAALFYGSNALGGVVNVISEEIPTTLPDRMHGDATGQFRSATDAGAAEASVTGSIGRVSLRAGGSFRDTGEMDTPLGAVPNSALRTWGGSAGLAWINGWGHAGAALRLYDSEYGIPPDPVAGHADGVTVRLDRWAAHGQLHWTRRAGPFEHLELDAKITRLDHLELEDGGVVGTEFGLNTHALELVGRHGGAGPFARGAVGVRGQRNDYGADRGRGTVLSVDEWDAAIYGLEELETGRVQLQFGGRFDWSRRTPTSGPDQVEGVDVRERDFANVSGSVAALYEVAPEVRLGLSVSRSFRTPSSDELYSDGPHLASYTFEVGNPELDAETGMGADLFLRVGRDDLRGEVAVFANRIDDFIQPRNTGAVRSGLFVYRATNTDALFAGAEASLEWTPLRHVALDGSVSLVRAEDRGTDRPLPLIPPVAADLGLRYERTEWYAQIGWRGTLQQDRVPERPELASGTWCDESGGAAGCQPVPGEFLPTDGYTLFNAAVGYRWFVSGSLHSLTLGVDNLTDETYRNHLSRIKELQPEAGRSINLLYRIGF